MIALPPPGAMDLETADRVTESLLRSWQDGAVRIEAGDTPSRAQLVDLCAFWMLRLSSELRAARLAARALERRRRHLERLLERMQRRLQPRLRRALHGRLSGHVFSLRLRRTHTKLPMAWTSRVEIE